MKLKHLLFLTVAIASLTAHSQTMTDSLVTYLNFDNGEAVDLSPRKVEYGFIADSLGTYDFEEGYNGGLAVHFKPGPLHNPAFLRSYDDNIINVLSSSGATIAMWVTLHDSLIRDNMFIISGNTAAFLSNSGSNTSRRLHSFYGDKLANTLFGHNETDTLIPGDTWNHVAITFTPKAGAGGEIEDSITTTIYTHGKYVKSSTVAASIIYPSLADTLLIASKPYSHQHQSQTGWKGKMDEIVIYNRSLSIEEIGYLMNDTLKAIYAPKAEITGNELVIENGSTTPSGDNNTDFGDVSVTANQGTIKSFVLNNTGAGEMQLTGDPLVEITGGAGSFTVTTNPSSVIAPGESTSFEIEFKPFLEGQKNATVTIASNAVGSPYVFSITGNGINSVGLSEEAAGNLKVYSYGKIVKISNSTSKPISLDLYDITGKQVRAIENIETEYQFFIEKKGFYLAKVRSGNELLLVKKLLIL